MLLFLHGVGEAFIPDRDTNDWYKNELENNPDYSQQDMLEVVTEDGLEQVGVQNLLHNGVPLILSKPAASTQPSSSLLPLFRDFVTLVPQLFLREDLSNRNETETMMETAYRLACSITAEPNIVLMGFSRGGFAAIQFLAIGSK